MRIFRNLKRACAVAGAAVLLAQAANAATLVVINRNLAGVGFNDPTAAAPVGGNTGTTVGQQRLIAFQAAADIWGTRLASTVPITIGAQFTPLTCDASSAVLGSAGPTNYFRNFTGAPLAGTFYPVALANALHGSDLFGGQDQISASFNSNIGTPGCLTSGGWYYGLDSNPPAGKTDFVAVLIHELGHGLGFLSGVSLSTGQKLGSNGVAGAGSNDSYMLFLESHGAVPADYPSMSDAQRLAASVNTGNLHWTGANVQSIAGQLSAGAVGSHVRMFAPSPAQAGSSVSHWDTVATPNQVMEPIYTGPLHHPQFENQLFRDIGWKVLGPATDFNADNMSDILWRDTSNGNAVVSFMTGASIVASTFVANLPLSWSLVGTGDFNGDGRSDLLWRDTTNGNVVASFMSGSTIALSSFLATLPLTWTVAGTGDFNGDGTRDILWLDASTGNYVVSFMSGASIALNSFVVTLPSPWVVAGVGDFNADGKADILWRNTSTGDTVVSLMNGASIASNTFVATLPTTWSVVGVGDFNGDGKADILWRDTSNGNLVVSLMNGAAITSSTFAANLPLTWSVQAIGDFNNDGKRDILWRDTSNGNTVVSLMNGSAITSSTFVANLPLSWAVQGGNAN